MVAQMIVTPIDNIEYNEIVDKQKVFTVEYDWSESVEVFDTNFDSVVSTRVSKVSLYEDYLRINGINHKILNMCSKEYEV